MIVMSQVPVYLIFCAEPPSKLEILIQLLLGQDSAIVRLTRTEGAAPEAPSVIITKGSSTHHCGLSSASAKTTLVYPSFEEV